MSRWENLTVTDFRKEVKNSKGVCIFPLGVIEKHGNHLPLGTDLITAHTIACLAAEIEKAVVFPPYYFTQILEAKHKPGAIAIHPKLQLELLENTCDEIGRNGFNKIILLNGHGGNSSLIPFFLRSLLNKQKDYMVYYPREYFGDTWNNLETKYKDIKINDGHAGQMETNIILAIAKELVKMQYIGKPGISLERQKHLGDISTSVSWYAKYPEHFAGDPKNATEARGREILRASVKYVANIIKIVKNDKIVQKLYKEFFSFEKKPS